MRCIITFVLTLISADIKISEQSWSIVEFVPYSVDLMSIDSNVMWSINGKSLRHSIQCHTPSSSGVNVFCQNVSGKKTCMTVYPPFSLILPVLNFLEEQDVVCTIVSKLNHLPIFCSVWIALKEKRVMLGLLYESVLF